jgi:hypothetical protein
MKTDPKNGFLANVLIASAVGCLVAAYFLRSAPIEEPVSFSLPLPAVLTSAPEKKPPAVREVTKKTLKRKPRQLASRSSNRRVLLSVSKETLRRQRFMEAELSATDLESREGINSLSFEEEALALALDSSSPSSDLGDLRTSETQVEVEFYVGNGIADVPYVEKIGTIVPNTFEALRESLDAVKSDPLVSAVFVGFAKPEIVRPSATLKKRAAKRQKQVAGASATPNAPSFEPAAVPLPSEKPPVLNLGPQLASLGRTPEVAVQSNRERALEPERAEEATVVAEGSLSQRAVNTLSSQVQLDPFAALSAAPFESDLFGRVFLAPDLEGWLAKEKGHIELYLQPLKSRDPQGTRFLSFHFPQDSFRESADVLKGRYRLVAGIFRPGDIDSPYAEIVHPEEINALTARSQVKFSLATKNLKVVSSPNSGERNRVRIFVSLFQGASAEYDTPTSIAGAEVKVLGFPEYGVLISNTEGNLEIPHFPSHSQAILEVRAKNYYRTFRTVPVFGGDVHVPLYMVQKQQIALLSALVRAPQQGRLSVAMGRVFDPETRNPLAGQTIELKDQPQNRGHYFRFFGPSETSRTTTSTGFYTDFNIQPAFRYWLRPDSQQRTFRMNVEESAAYYTELGRGGSKSFFGRLVDPNCGKVAGARVWLVGDEEFEAVSREDGTFEIPGIDFPSGVLAIDVKAPGYRLTRHTVEWNPRQTAATKDLFMVQERFVEQGLEFAQSRVFGPAPSSGQASGSIIGGAYGSLFEQETGCLEVQLWAIKQDKVVDPEHGPYPLVGGGGEKICVNQSHPGFTYINLPPAEYLLKWKESSGKALGSRVIHVGMERDSVCVN